jgi:MoxR-like ATPase
VLADEINRASPKTQSALLEAMQERRVSVGGVSHPLPRPFFVIATQNPIELEGTYPLPEAQLDRFLLKIEVKRNSPDVLERIVLGRTLGVDPVVAPVLSRESVAELISLAAALPIPRVVANYIARLVDGSHPGQSKAAEGVRFGASPRAALGLAAGARAHALFQGRGYPSTDDVRAVAHGVLGHRIVLDYSARLEGRSGTSVVEALLSEIDPSPEALPKSLQEIKV